MAETQVSPPPYYSPGRVADDAPWKWLAMGWADFRANLPISLAYGVTFVGIGYLLSAGLWATGLAAWIPIAAGSFAIVGPLVAVGLYEVSRRHHAGEDFTWRQIALVKAASPLGLAYIGFLVMFALFVWMRIAIMLYALFISGTYLPMNDFMGFVLGTPQGLAMLVVGTLIGGVIAFFIYAVCVVSVPLLMDRQTDFLGAVASSIQTVLKSPKPMLLWAWIIGGLVALGSLTAFLGLIIAFPVLGHATWHAYKDVYE